MLIFPYLLMVIYVHKVNVFYLPIIFKTKGYQRGVKHSKANRKINRPYLLESYMKRELTSSSRGPMARKSDVALLMTASGSLSRR